MKDSEQQQFNILYEQTKGMISKISRRYHRQSEVPVEEFISQLNEELWLSYRKFEPERGATIETWLNMRLRDRAKRIIRDKEGTYYHRVEGLKPPQSLSNNESGDDEAAPTPEIADPVNLEDYVLRKKEADQRQLVDSLVNCPSQADPVTTLIVTEFPKHKSITALAKALGLHHEVVKRKLAALGRRYDANRFGDMHDYLAV